MKRIAGLVVALAAMHPRAIEDVSSKAASNYVVSRAL
jgi:hypothetical protein